MPISIDGSGTIAGVSVGGLPDGTVDTDTIADAAVTAAKRGAGAILQVVEGSTSTEVTVSTTTYTDTGLSATITPTSASNKILILVSQQVLASRSSSDSGLGIRLLRDSTVIWTPVESSVGPVSSLVSAGGSISMSVWAHQHCQYLDSPSTTSAVTYKTQGRPYNTADSGAATFQAANTVENGNSRIVLMEVAA